jgi:hypothetical protein
VSAPLVASFSWKSLLFVVAAKSPILPLTYKKNTEENCIQIVSLWELFGVAVSVQTFMS